jgi:hypothetical protein
MGVKPEQAFNDTLLDNEHLLTGDVTLLDNGHWTTLDTYTVPDGQAIQFGQGSIRSQEGAVGRIYIDLVDDGAGAEEGIVRLSVENPTGTERIEIERWPTVRLRSGDHDSLRDQLAFPADGRWFPADSVVVLEMDAATDDNDTVDVSACGLLIDIQRAPFVPGS